MSEYQMPPKVKSQKSKVKKVKSTAEGPHTFSLLLQVNIFRARQQSHKLSHADLRRIFDDVEERAR